MLAVHSLEIGLRQAMPEVTDYSVDEKELPMFVPIMSPRVGRSFAYNLKFFSSSGEVSKSSISAGFSALWAYPADLP